MAHLSKRVRVTGSGGAGPFHLPQREGRVNHLSVTHPEGIRRRHRLQIAESPVSEAQQEAARSLVKQVVDKFRRRTVRKAA